MNRFPYRVFGPYVIALAASCLSWSADAGDMAPIQLVSESAALCLELPRVEESFQKLRGSDLLVRLKAFPPVERLLAGPGYQKLIAVENFTRATTGQSLSHQLLAAFGESILIAVYLPEGQRPQGILIGKARDEDSLKKAIQTWSTLDTNHVSQTRERKGQQYVRRAKATNPAEVVYYSALERIFVLSDQEALVQQAIDRYLSATPTSSPDSSAPPSIRSLGDADLYRTNRARLPKEAAAFAFINARAWDKAVETVTQKSPDAAWVRNAIQSVSAIGITLRLDNEFVVDGVADVSPESRSSDWQRFVKATQGGGNWDSRIPADAVAAISGRMNMRPLIQTWLTKIPQTQDFLRGRKALSSACLGQDVFLDVLPALLQDWTLTATAESSADAPAELRATFSMQGQSHDPTRQHGIDNALHFAMNLAAVHFSYQGSESASPVIANAELTDAGLVRSLSGLSTWNPAYVLGRDSLQLATNRTALTSSSSNLDSSRLTITARRYFSSASQLVWIDAAKLRDLLSKQKERLADMAAPSSEESRDRVRMQLTKVTEAIKLFDAAFVAASFDNDHVKLIFGASLDRPE